MSNHQSGDFTVNDSYTLGRDTRGDKTGDSAGYIDNGNYALSNFSKEAIERDMRIL